MTVGQRLRTTRMARGFSLQNVADQAEMSVATLSRIETSKQGVELGTFLQLARILECDPGDLLASVHKEADSITTLIRDIGILTVAQRTRLWRRLASDVRSDGRARRQRVHSFALQVEELLAQLDFLHAEIEAVRERLNRKN